MKNVDALTTTPADDSPHNCEPALARLLPPKVEANLRSRFPEILHQRRHMFHLAMTEAAALASQTGLPQLFFPMLALEKAESLAAWNRRQQLLRANNVFKALAA